METETETKEAKQNEYKKTACDLSIGSISRGSGPFGAIIVQNATGEIVGKGHNMVTTSNDPTLHAEIVAIRDACHVLDTFVLDGYTLYSSCEPCPMCLSAAYWARISTIYYANTQSDAKEIGFDDSFIYDELKKPMEERTMKMCHLPECRTEYAKPVFDKWNSLSDKTPY